MADRRDLRVSRLHELRRGGAEQRRALSFSTTPSALQRFLGSIFRGLAQHTPLYHAWIYLLLAVALFVWAVARRDLLISCLVGSGLSYQTSILLLANAPDFRFAHWMITCTCLGTALAIGAWRARRAPAPGPPETQPTSPRVGLDANVAT